MTDPRRVTPPKAAGLVLFAAAIVLCLAAVFGSNAKDAASAAPAVDKWTCSMCPQFILPAPGKCPKCFMDLIPLEGMAGGGSRLELYLSPEAAELAGISADLAETVDSDDPDDETAENPAPALPSVPASAVLTSKGRFFVYVESMEEDYLVYTMREIEPAGMENGRVFVASGVDEGEMVAATGVFRIDSAMQIYGKTSIANLPDGPLSDAEGADLPPYQPAERGDADIRAGIPGVDAWFDRYEQVRAALAKDENGKSLPPSLELAQLIGEARPSGAGELDETLSRLAAASGELSLAADLESRREAFRKLTAGMTLFARRYGSPGNGLNLVYCPMAFGGDGAYWLQPGERVDNPYHGLEMPLCGWKVDFIQPFSSGDDGAPDNQE